MEPAFKVLTEFYSLPRMIGFWICDPEQMRQREEATKKKWWPVALLFFWRPSRDLVAPPAARRRPGRDGHGRSFPRL